MELTQHFWVPKTDASDARTIYITATKGVSKQVLEYFIRVFKESPEEWMRISVGAIKVFKSGYNEKYYTLVRKSSCAFHIEDRQSV